MYINKRFVSLLLMLTGVIGGALFFNSKLLHLENTSEIVIIQSASDDYSADQELAEATINNFLTQLPDELAKILKDTEDVLLKDYQEASKAMNDAKDRLVPSDTSSYAHLDLNLQNYLDNTLKGFDEQSTGFILEEVAAMNELVATLSIVPLFAKKIITQLKNQTKALTIQYKDKLSATLKEQANRLVSASHFHELATAQAERNLVVMEQQYEVTSPLSAWEKFSKKGFFIFEDAWRTFEPGVIKSIAIWAGDATDTLIETTKKSIGDLFSQAIAEWSEGKGGTPDPKEQEPEKYPLQLKNGTQSNIYVYYVGDGNAENNLIEPSGGWGSISSENRNKAVSPNSSLILSIEQYKVHKTFIVMKYLDAYNPFVFDAGKTIFITAKDTNNIVRVEKQNNAQADFKSNPWAYATYQEAFKAAQDLAKSGVLPPPNLNIISN